MIVLAFAAACIVTIPPTFFEGLHIRVYEIQIVEPAAHLLEGLKKEYPELLMLLFTLVYSLGH
jgi:hypothetical protein